MDDITIIHGDCLDVLPTLDRASIAAVATDPPYGVGLGMDKDARARGHGLGKGPYADFEDTYDDFVAEVIPRLNAYLDLAHRAAVFTGPHVQEQRKASAIGGVYCPAGAGRHSWGFKSFLPVLLYGSAPDLNKGATVPTTIQSTVQAEKNGHPCPKPLSWMIWLIKLTTRPGELVVDPFAGSGTTAVACMKTGRRCIAIEREAKYVEIIHRRVAEARTPLLDLDGVA